MTDAFNIVSALLAFAAAGFWLWSTAPKIPDDLGPGRWDASPVGTEELMDSLKKQSFRNAWGARAAAGAAVCQALAALVGLEARW